MDESPKDIIDSGETKENNAFYCIAVLDRASSKLRLLYYHLLTNPKAGRPTAADRDLHIFFF